MRAVPNPGGHLSTSTPPDSRGSRPVRFRVLLRQGGLRESRHGRGDGYGHIAGRDGRVIQPLRDTDPRALGAFTIEGRIGVGGMGVVYMARDDNGVRVALKVVRPEIADQPQFRTRFAREVEAARVVSGTYTARLLDADTDDTPQWIATEYVQGPTLAEQVEAQGPLQQQQARLLALGLAEAIDAIHAAGLVHRDLKPSNVILSAVGPKVIDFGISQAMDATSLTQTGVQVGSLAWMSPEQVTGHKLTPASDMFALGLLLAYAALGRHPYGDGRPEAVAFRMVNQTPDLEGMSPALEQVCRRLLAEQPGDRPSPQSVVSALTDEPTQMDDITRVMGSGWDATVAGAPIPVTEASSPGNTRHPAMRRGRRLIVAIAGSTTLVAAAAAALALGVISLPSSLGSGSDADAAFTSTPSDDPVAAEASQGTKEAGSPRAEADETTAASDGPARYPLLVDTTLTVRAGPYLDAEKIGQIPANGTVLVTCTAPGDPVQETEDVVNDQWNRITAPVDGWVSDAYVDSGSSPAPQPECAKVPSRAAAAPPNDNSAWPDVAAADTYASSFSNDAVAAGASPPAFPTEVAGYELSYEDKVTSRAFEGSTREVSDLPATMNGCGQQRFYVRWRSLATGYTLEATWVYQAMEAGGEPVLESAGGTASGNAGWMSSYGCTQPGFRLIESPGPGNLTDVVVEYQVWKAAV